MPKKKKIIRKPLNKIKKKPVFIVKKTKSKVLPLIITTKNKVKVIPRNNPLKNKSENWLQKTKFVSSALDQFASAHPIASFGATVARMHGYGRKCGGAIRRTIQPYHNHISTSTNYKSRAQNMLSKYGKYIVPSLVAAGAMGTNMYIRRSAPYAFKNLLGGYEIVE